MNCNIAHLDRDHSRLLVPMSVVGLITKSIPWLSFKSITKTVNLSIYFTIIAMGFGHYEVIDFLAVLFGYAISGERTLEAFYEYLTPWAEPFMALFNREQLPSRSALSRFLASFTPVAAQTLRELFLEDLLTRPLSKERQRGELRDRA